MIKDAIILCGGLGTRLKDVNPKLPKALVDVAGRPFLYYLIKYLEKERIEKFILAVGYKHEFIEEYIYKNFPDIHVEFSVEQEALGTGGAVQMAAKLSTEEDVLVTNGDTFFNLCIQSMYSFHRERKALCTLALKPLLDSGRYGLVTQDLDQVVTSFKEKQSNMGGLINGGCYILSKQGIEQLNLPDKFSFEKDFLEKNINGRKILGFIQDVYFIDIGIPSDLDKARLYFNNKL